MVKQKTQSNNTNNKTLKKLEDDLTNKGYCNKMTTQTNKQAEMKYKIIFDNGKPYDILVYNEEELKKELKDFYNNQEDKTNYFNAIVLNENNEDVSDSQFIEEIICNILEQEEGLK